MNIIFCPSDYLTKIIGAGGEAIVSTWKIGKRPHHLPVFQDKPEVDIAGGIGSGVEGRAAPSFPQWFQIGSLRDTNNDSLGILDVPSDTAVWSAERTQVEY
jgi:hypothetical protein